MHLLGGLGPLDNPAKPPLGECHEFPRFRSGVKVRAKTAVDSERRRCSGSPHFCLDVKRPPLTAMQKPLILGDVGAHAP